MEVFFVLQVPELLPWLWVHTGLPNLLPYKRLHALQREPFQRRWKPSRRRREPFCRPPEAEPAEPEAPGPDAPADPPELRPLQLLPGQERGHRTRCLQLRGQISINF